MTRKPPEDAPRVLLVDDDPIVADSLAAFLRDEGLDTATCVGAAEAREALEEAARPGPSARARPFNLVVTDVSMPGEGGLELLDHVAEHHPATVVVMLTGYGTIESAVEAIRRGAFDYLSKPVVDSELRLSVERALRQQALLAENTALRRQLSDRHGLTSIVGSDYRMLKAFEMIESVAPSKATVLMAGESGTGKSLIARSIHHLSPRASAPFVEIHCGSVPETLLESELFGHVKGAFTGAHADKQGKFLAADTGTIFIDEINSATPAMQLKLLRVLQERRFEPIGSTETVEVDVRVILASNQPLEALVAEGRFREDLYYRINVIRIELPPLRERAGDVPTLAEHFLAKFGVEHGRTMVGIEDDALDALRRYPMPGNVRELANIIERAVVLAKRPTVTLEDLPQHVVEGESGLDAHRRAAAPGADEPWEPIALSEALRAPERDIILRALRANAWNRQATADQLGINRTTLYKKMKSLDIERLAG